MHTMQDYNLSTLPYVDVCMFLLIFWFYFMCFTDEHDWSRAYIT